MGAKHTLLGSSVQKHALREATPYGQVPTSLMCDRDSQFGSRFACVAATTTSTLLRTPYQAPRANAICERFLGSGRRDCLEHLLILHEKQLQRVLNQSVTPFNRARPHQGIGQHLPEPPASPALSPHPSDKIIGIPILGGLHHDYQRAAERRQVRLIEKWKLELNIIMVSTISACAFLLVENPRSWCHLVIAPQTSRLANTRAIFRKKLLHDVGEENFFSVQNTTFREPA
jgi:hypothetical protein